jgi:hypothetical protein
MGGSPKKMRKLVRNGTGCFENVPISNAFPKRVFSMMSYIWSDERSQLRPEAVKAELTTKINFEMKCDEFVNFFPS